MKHFSKFLILMCILQTGCATWKKETLAYMGGALVAGAVIGAAQAPKGDDKAMHGLLWGGVASAATGATLVYLKKDNEEIRERDLQIQSLKMQLSENTRIIDEGESQFFNKELPGELQSLMVPGSWQLYEVDEWKRSSKGKFVHQDKVLKVKPAKLKSIK